VILIGNFWYFGKLVAEEGGHLGEVVATRSLTVVTLLAIVWH